METLEAIGKRKSVRSFSSERVPNETLDTIVGAGFRAPVASSDYASLHLSVIQNREVLDQIAIAASDMVFKLLGVRKNMDWGAPVLVIVSSKPAKMPGIEYANAACVLESMVLAATDQGVDSIIWGGAAMAVRQNPKLKEALSIPDGYEPLLCASFGYAAMPTKPKKHAIAVSRVD